MDGSKTFDLKSVSWQWERPHEWNDGGNQRPQKSTKRNGKVVFLDNGKGYMNWMTVWAMTRLYGSMENGRQELWNMWDASLTARCWEMPIGPLSTRGVTVDADLGGQRSHEENVMRFPERRWDTRLRTMRISEDHVLKMLWGRWERPHVPYDACRMI